MTTVTPGAIGLAVSLPAPYLAVEGGEARIAREATVVATHFPEADTVARIVREGVSVAHHYPEDETDMRLARLGVVIAISRPHGWD